MSEQCGERHGSSQAEGIAGLGNSRRVQCGLSAGKVEQGLDKGEAPERECLLKLCVSLSHSSPHPDLEGCVGRGRQKGGIVWKGAGP